MTEFKKTAIVRTLEDYVYRGSFELATMRMVAEHVEDPNVLVASLGRLIKPSRKVVYNPTDTPASIVAAILPPDDVLNE